MIPGGKEIKIKYIMPLVSIDGLLYITDERVYMQPTHPYVLGQSVINIKISKVRELFKRRYTLMDLGLEIVSYSIKQDSGSGAKAKHKKKSMYLVFKDKNDRDIIYGTLLQLVDLKECATTEKDVEYYTNKWTNYEMSNFDYLMILNSYAQRSLQDLTAYPVFPWVIKEFKTEFLDLDDPNTFRDLTQPIGALNKERLADFKERYDETPPEMERFLYGSHFSCPGYVIGFRLRSDPQW